MHSVCLDKPELGQSRKIAQKRRHGTQCYDFLLVMENYTIRRIFVNGKKVSMSPQNAINKQHLRTFRMIKSLSDHYIRGVKSISFN